MNLTAKCVVLLTIAVGTVARITMAQVVVSGSVVSAHTDEPVAAAHVVLRGSRSGTISNTEGRFEMVVPSLPATIEIQHIGFARYAFSVVADGPRWFDVRLSPVVLALDEIVVTTDDYAENVMRRVIQNKRRTLERLKTVQSVAYSRTTLSNERQVMNIHESVFNSYWDSERGFRDELLSFRETDSLYQAFGIVRFGQLQNLYDDVIRINGVDFIGPTHPDATNHYEFTFGHVSALDSLRVLEIYASPKTTTGPTFIGSVYVVDSLFVLAGASLRVGRHVQFPSEPHEWAVFYHQQFRPVDVAAWLPVDLRLDGVIATTRRDGRRLQARIEQQSKFADYRVNEELPQAPFASNARLSVNREAVFEDYLFMRGYNVIPLSPRELEALDRLRRQSPELEVAFLEPRGRDLLSLIRPTDFDYEGPQFVWPSVFGFVPRAGFNRVDGVLSGIGQVIPLSSGLRAEWQLAQASGLSRVRYRIGAQHRFSQKIDARLSYESNTRPRASDSRYSKAVTSLAPLAGRGDYTDYYWSERWRGSVRYTGRMARWTLHLDSDDGESRDREITRSWPTGRAFRDNGAIEDGRTTNVALGFALGDSRQPFRTEPVQRLEAFVEYGPDALGNASRYLKTGFTADASFRTLLRSRPRPQLLEVRFDAGTSAGSVPLHRLHSLDGTVVAFATMGTLRSVRDRPLEGRHWFAAYWEYSFDTLLFEWLGMRGAVDRQMGVRLFGTHARTWAGDELLFRAQEKRIELRYGTRHELGVSVARVGGSSLRVDFGRELTQSRWLVSFGFDLR